MSILQAIVLGLVQGLSEFIPISSTAHLRLVPALLGWRDPGAAASAVIQLGTLLAVLVYFARDIAELTKAFVLGIVRGKPFGDQKSRLAWYIGLGTIPIAVLGLTFREFIETEARNLWLIVGALVGMALLLWVSEVYAAKRRSREINEITFADAMIIGLGQCLALIPGSSRSGSTIMTGLFRNLTHEAAARFSFLLSIPAILASGLLELVAQRDHLGTLGWVPIGVAVFVSFISGWASIHFLLQYLKRHKTTVFIIYRIALGVVIAGLLFAGILQPFG